MATLGVASDTDERLADTQPAVNGLRFTAYFVTKPTFTLVADGTHTLQPRQTASKLAERRFLTGINHMLGVGQHLGASKFAVAFLNALMFLGAPLYCFIHELCLFPAASGSGCSLLYRMNFT
jgi:hypothetical protein